MSGQRSVTNSYYSTVSSRPGNPNMLRNSFFDPVEKYKAITTPTAPETQLKTFSYTPSANKSSKDNGRFNFDTLKEVRGKYARPASNVKNDKKVDFTPRRNSVVSRPSTAGSLMRIQRPHDRPRQRQKSQIIDKNAIADYEIARPQPPRRRSSRNSNNGRRPAQTRPTQDWKPYETLPEPAKFNDYELESPGAEEVPDDMLVDEDPAAQLQDEDAPLQRPSTSGTWRTSSTRVQYIEELEKMIELERQRRAEAENEVNRLSAKARH